MFAFVTPEFDVNAVTILCRDSDQYNATLGTNPLARLNKNPTSTFVEVDPWCSTVIGSLNAVIVVSNWDDFGLVNAIGYL